MANLNSVEASIVNIRNIIPSIILTFHNCMRKHLPEKLDEISKILTNDIKLQTYLKYKAPNSIREFYKDGEIEFDYLKCVDPLNLVKLFSYSKSDTNTMVDDVEDNIYTLFFKDFFVTLRNNEDTMTKQMKNVFTMTPSIGEPYVTSIRSPYLAQINLCEMSSIGTRSSYFDDFCVPRMGVKTVVNYKISEFMQQFDNRNYFNEWFSSQNTENILDLDDKKVNHNALSELLVGQIDYQTLGTRIMRMYKDIYRIIIEKEEYRNLLMTIDTYISDNGFDHFDKLEKNFYWATFVLISKILNADKVSSEIEYENNTEDVVPKGTSEFTDYVKSLIDGELNTLISDCTMSMVLTFLAKVGRTDIAYPYDINRDMLNGILEVTLEDINYFNNKFEKADGSFGGNIDKDSELYNYVNPLNRKKSGSIVRKRMLDYITLSWLAQKDYNSNFNGFNYLGHLYGKDSDYNKFNHMTQSERNSNKKGSTIYKFAVRNLQEIYSNMTYTTNFTHNIVDMKHGKYVYKATIDLARAGIDLYVVDTDIKIFLNLGCSEKDKTVFFISSNNYDFNTLKNHRALAAIYKASVHVLFKLIYVLEGIKKYSEYTKQNDIPEEHRERYVKVKSQLGELSTILKRFKDWGVSDIFGREYESFVHILRKILPAAQYSLGAFVGGKMTSVSRLTDDFTDLNDDAIVTNDILATLHTFDKLEDEKVIDSKDESKSFYMTQFKNIASVYAGADNSFDHTDEISVEFDSDDDIVNTLEKFSQLDNPELRSIHRNLFESYEDMKNGFDYEIKSQLFSKEVYDLLDKSIAHLDNNERTIESIALTASIVTYADNIFNIDKENRSAEDISKFNSKIEEFDNKLLKSIEKISDL